MKKRCFFFCILWLCCSCHNLPPIETFRPGLTATGHRACAAPPFLKGSWQLVHSIEAQLPRGRNSVLIGVSNLRSEAQALRSVMMTIEGIVILDASYGPGLTINKGVPPFDDERFARGVMEDIRLALFQPTGTHRVEGVLEAGRPVCRYMAEDGGITDLIGPEGENWEIKRYRKGGILNRTVRLAVKPPAGAGETAPLPERLRITAPGVLGYDLSLTLLEARPLGPSYRLE